MFRLWYAPVSAGIEIKVDVDAEIFSAFTCCVASSMRFSCRLALTFPDAFFLAVARFHFAWRFISTTIFFARALRSIGAPGAVVQSQAQSFSFARSEKQGQKQHNSGNTGYNTAELHPA